MHRQRLVTNKPWCSKCVVLGLIWMLAVFMATANLLLAHYSSSSSVMGGEFTLLAHPPNKESHRQSLHHRQPPEPIWKDPSPENRTFFGVHVGKAGGSTVFANMRRIVSSSSGWHERNPEFRTQLHQQGANEMAASHKTLGLVHLRMVGTPEDRAKATTFLWVIRDPLDRIASAFYYEHLRNISPIGCNNTRSINHHTFYCHCYNHVDDLARDVAINKMNSTVPLTTKVVINFKHKQVNCSDLAWNILTPISPRKVRQTDYRTFSHLNRNYYFYYNQTIHMFPHKDIVVIRTEHMWDDLQQLEYSLGGNASIGKETHNFYSHGSESFQLKKKLTNPVLMQQFCCAIRREAEIYRELIEKAINLQPWQKKESLDAFAKRCNLDLCPPEKSGQG